MCEHPEQLPLYSVVETWAPAYKKSQLEVADKNASETLRSK